MSRHGRIHWLSPTLMVICFFSGVAFALAHHLFYANLNGRKVDSKDYSIAGFQLSQQQVNIATGTALAFMSKICLIFAISIAYTQTFWTTFSRRKTQMRSLDAMHAAIGNMWVLVQPHIWWRYPTLISLALLGWLLPITSIITPSTLLVSSASEATFRVEAPPQLDFASLRFMNPGTISSWNFATSGTMDYRGPHQSVERIAHAVASSGSVSNIPSPGVNATWTSAFAGPYLKCDSMDAAMVSRVEDNIRINFIDENSTFPCTEYRNYLAWTATMYNDPGDWGEAQVSFAPYPKGSLNAGTVGPLDFERYVGDAEDVPKPFRIGIGDGIHYPPPDQTATLYVGAMPKWTKDSCNNGGRIFESATFLTCRVMNTTYSMRFNYTSGAQDIATEFPDLASAKTVDTVPGVYYNNGTDECSKLNQSNDTCVVDPVTLQKLSYQAIMDAFGRILVGSVRNGEESLDWAVAESTSVLATPLIYTNELNFLASTNNWPSAADGTFTVRGNEFDSLFEWTTTKPEMSLAQGLEQMFQNITISMLSAPNLYPNASSPFAPPLTNVTYHSVETVYSYSARTLWLSYGIAIAFTFLAVCIGLGRIMIAGAAYSNDFSTILRATRHADIDVETTDEDFCDPLPKDLATAVVWLSPNRNIPEPSDEKAKLVSTTTEWWPQKKKWMPVGIRS